MNHKGGSEQLQNAGLPWLGALETSGEKVGDGINPIDGGNP